MPAGSGDDDLVLDSLPVSSAPSCTLLRHLAAERQERSAAWTSGELVVFADPVFADVDVADGDIRSIRGISLKPLPGTRVEAEAIAARFPGRAHVWLGADATEWPRGFSIPCPPRDRSPLHLALSESFPLVPAALGFRLLTRVSWTGTAGRGRSPDRFPCAFHNQGPSDGTTLPNKLSQLGVRVTAWELIVRAEPSQRSSHDGSRLLETRRHSLSYSYVARRAAGGPSHLHVRSRGRIGRGLGAASGVPREGLG